MWEFWRSRLSKGKTRHRRGLPPFSEDDSPSVREYARCPKAQRKGCICSAKSLLPLIQASVQSTCQVSCLTFLDKTPNIACSVHFKLISCYFDHMTTTSKANKNSKIVIDTLCRVFSDAACLLSAIKAGSHDVGRQIPIHKTSLQPILIFYLYMRHS